MLEAEVLERGQFGDGCCDSSPSTISSPCWTASATCRCRPTFVATMRMRIVSATRRSIRTSGARWPRPPPACTSRRKCWKRSQPSGVEIARITLHVGLGTFAPLRVERVDEVRLHRERYTLSAATADAINRAVAEGRRIVAVGTTVVRTLEHCALQAAGSELEPHSGDDGNLYLPRLRIPLGRRAAHQFSPAPIQPADAGERFRGREQVLAAYRHAVREKYRFFSYGDCMFIALTLRAARLLA